jgi:hypothetical protein
MALRRRGSLPFAARSANHPDGEEMSRQYPLVYRMSRSGFMFCLSAGIVAVALCLTGAVYFGYFYTQDDAGPLLAGMSLIFLLLLGVPCIGSALRTRVQVHADFIESRSLMRTRRMNRADIAGFRIVSAEGTRRLRLESGTTGVSALTLPAYIAFDARIDDWLTGTVNYDAREQQASLNSILADPDLPGSNEEKLAKLNAARRIARGLFLLALAITGWAWFYPRPYDVVVTAAALMPWVALALAARHGSLYRVNPMHNDMAADLSAVYLMPVCAVAIRALFDFSIIDGWQLFWLTLAGAVVCVALMYLLLAREFHGRPGSVLAFGIFMLAYAYGSISLANVRLDRHEPERHAARVVDTRVTGSDNKTYEFRLASWGPRTTEENVEVTSELHGRVAKGDTVCVYLWPGALGVRWYEVRDCPKD